MRFFTRISTRLWITYVLLVAFVLVTAFSGIVIAFRNSPLLYWNEFVQLNYVTNSLANRLNFIVDAHWAGIVEVFLTEAKMGDVRVLIVDDHGAMMLDSASRDFAPIPQINDPSAIFHQSDGSIRLLRDENNEHWFYQINPINDGYYLLSAIPRPELKISAIFQDELLEPLFRVGILSLVFIFIISWFVARWITGPLQTISRASTQLASGDFPPIKMEGPAEVQELARVINTMDRQMRDSIQSQKDFVANVSHEFKTPLTSIQGFAQAIFDDAVQTPKERRNAAQVILEETDRLNHMVNGPSHVGEIGCGHV